MVLLMKRMMMFILFKNRGTLVHTVSLLLSTIVVISSSLSEPAIFDNLSTSTASSHLRHHPPHHHHLQHNFTTCIDHMPELEKLVHTNGSRTKVFITYHNGIGEQAIRLKSCNYTRDWIIPVHCNATKYFEYYAYKEISQKYSSSDFADVDYILIAGYKTFTPKEWSASLNYTLDVHATDQSLFKLIHFALHHPEHDVIPIFTAKGAAVLKELPAHHGQNSLDALKLTLKRLNWTEAEINDNIWANVIFRNSMLIKPWAFLRLSQIMSQVIDIVETTPNLQQMYSVDANYANVVPSIAYKAFGTPYYMLHCFIMERIVSVILDHLKAHISFRLFSEILQEANRYT